MDCYSLKLLCQRLSFNLKFDVLHILYGEDYFRFSHILFWRKKLVVTFHQPPDILDQELSLGNYNGRVAGFTHFISRRRLKCIDACIVMSSEQKEIAEKYMDASKIYIIPLGVNLDRYNLAFNKHNLGRKINQVITVGEWLRDWDLYLKVVDECYLSFPEIEFILINNRLSDLVLREVEKRKNVKYLQNVTDEDLETLYLSSLAMYLPLKGAAGSNAINEALALGCPVISNLKFDFLDEHQKFTFVMDEFNKFSYYIQKLNALTKDQLMEISVTANRSIQKMSWASVSSELLKIYRSVL